MSDPRQNIDAVVAAVLDGEDLPFETNEIQEFLEDLESDGDLEWHTGSEPDYVYSDLEIPDWDEESGAWIEDHVSESRSSELEAGGDPTDAEKQMWREAYIENFLEDPEWDGGYVVRTFTDSEGREVAALLHTSGEGWDYAESIEAVYASEEEAYAAMDSKEHTILEPY